MPLCFFRSPPRLQLPAWKISAWKINRKISWKVGLTTVLLWLALLAPAQAAPFPTSLPPEQQALHLLNRLSFGARPTDLQQVQALGLEQYLQQQLHPDQQPESPHLIQQLSQFPTLTLAPADLIQNYQIQNILNRSDQLPENEGQNRPQNGIQDGNQNELDSSSQRRQAALLTASLPYSEASQAKLLRALSSTHQLEEVMVDFWYNHFNVSADKGIGRQLVGAYEREAIRPYVLGKFRDLLGATARHPAMLFYLDGWVNGISPRAAMTGPDPRDEVNENYAREVMELHTLGVNGGYSEQDIITLAQIFTGWGFCEPGQFADVSFCFNPRRHDASDKVFLGQPISGGGLDEGERALDLLATRPATAQHISYRLAQYFVADQPPPALVQRLAETFTATDGEIRALLDTLFHSPEFWQTEVIGSKFKSPYQFAVAAVRATGTTVQNPRPLIAILQQLGMRLYSCPSPDGYKNTQDVWLSPYSITRRLDWVAVLASGRMRLDMPPGSQSPPQPVDADQLLATLGPQLSPQTRQAIAATPPRLRSAAIFGSPDLMYR